MALLTVGALTSCVDDAAIIDIYPGGNGDGLSVAPVVSEPTLVTRAPSIVTLNEELLNTLDVFVEPVTDGVGTGSFLKQYHRTSTDNIDEIGHQVQSLLANNWRAEGLEFGKYYNIYVATNNPLTKVDVANVAALKGLTYDEVSAGVASLNDVNNIANRSGNIYKQYVSENPLNCQTTDKEFMMDGIIENWTPDAATRDQVFQPVTLNRAAAKIVLNVNFDADFLKSLTHNKIVTTGEGGTETVTWEEKTAAEKVTITGSPAWRFYNFAFGAPVFTPETQGAGIEVHSSDRQLFSSFIEDTEHEFQIITYSYPNKWNDASGAPSFVVSIGYTQGDNTSYNYYRIPIVPKTTTTFERNHIYVINATIATRGSELHEDVDEIKDVHYYVLPWNDESNSAAVHNEVEAVQHKYLKVNPKVYTLRGDGAQSVDINYLKASGTSVGWKLFTYDSKGNQTAVVANNADGATRAWFYNSTGAFTQTYSDTGSGITWGNTMGVDIVQSTEGVSGSSGKFTVTSQALTNKAIKYIRFRVFLNDDETLYEDVIIRHFPTDNIQNITGTWSSYHSTTGSTQEVTLTTTILSEAQAWAAQYGVDFTTEEVIVTDDITYAEYSAHSSETGYSIASAQETVTTNTFKQYVQNNDVRASANGIDNGVIGEDGYYYWGVTPQLVDQSWDDTYYTWDYYTTRNYYGTPYPYYWYRYTNRYRAHYTHTYTQTQYSVTAQMTGTGNWVDWNRDAGKAYSQANVKYTRATIFTAKVYDASNSRIVAIEPIRSGTSNANYQYTYRMATSQAQGGYNTYYEGGGNNAYGTGNSGSMANLTNNHMYVIQISATSTDYILGRPILGNPNANLSQDDVVSPAFMIASQLGAVTTTNSNTTAADHCARYMEVAADGTRYTGWRLPTPDEIGVITRYQNGTINGVTISSNYQALTPVLTGNTYWSLTGNPASTGIGSGGPYLRCVRDLSAEEIEHLNNFDAIIQKYQNK